MTRATGTIIGVTRTGLMVVFRLVLRADGTIIYRPEKNPYVLGPAAVA